MNLILIVFYKLVRVSLQILLLHDRFTGLLFFLHFPFQVLEDFVLVMKVYGKAHTVPLHAYDWLFSQYLYFSISYLFSQHVMRTGSLSI